MQIKPVVPLRYPQNPFLKLQRFLILKIYVSAVSKVPLELQAPIFIL